MDRETLLDLMPAYALGALDAEERAQVEALLAADEEARALLAEYEELTGLLMLTTPARQAPAHLPDDLRARLAGATPPPAALDTPRPALRRRWLSPALAAAAMLAVVVAGVALLAALSPTVSSPGAALYHNLVNQAGSQRFALVAQSAPVSGEMVASSDGTQAVIQVSRLPALSPERSFQLWLINDQGAQSGGVLKIAQPQGDNYIIVPLAGLTLADYQAFAVSVEPQGGSESPSAEIVFTVPASA